MEVRDEVDRLIKKFKKKQTHETVTLMTQQLNVKKEQNRKAEGKERNE